MFSQLTLDLIAQLVRAPVARSGSPGFESQCGHFYWKSNRWPWNLQFNTLFTKPMFCFAHKKPMQIAINIYSISLESRKSGLSKIYITWQCASVVSSCHKALFCFAHSKLIKIAINMYATPLESCEPGLSIGICHVLMRSAVKNALVLPGETKL